MNLDNITDNIMTFLVETVDELLALGVVGGYMISAMFGFGNVPIELPAGVLAFYFIRKQE